MKTLEEVCDEILQEEELSEIDFSPAPKVIPQLEIQQVILDPASLHQSYKELINELKKMNEALTAALGFQRTKLKAQRATIQWLQEAVAMIQPVEDPEQAARGLLQEAS